MGSIRKFNASMAESMYGIYVDRKTFMTYTKSGFNCSVRIEFFHDNSKSAIWYVFQYFVVFAPYKKYRIEGDGNLETAN